MNWSNELPPPYSIIKFILISRYVQSCMTQLFRTALRCYRGSGSSKFTPIARCSWCHHLSEVICCKSLLQFYDCCSSPLRFSPMHVHLYPGPDETRYPWTALLTVFVPQFITFGLLQLLTWLCHFECLYSCGFSIFSFQKFMNFLTCTFYPQFGTYLCPLKTFCSFSFANFSLLDPLRTNLSLCESF